VLVVEEGSWDCGDEELTAVGIWSRILHSEALVCPVVRKFKKSRPATYRHAQQARLIMLEIKILVSK